MSESASALASPGASPASSHAVATPNNHRMRISPPLGFAYEDLLFPTPAVPRVIRPQLCPIAGASSGLTRCGLRLRLAARRDGAAPRDRVLHFGERLVEDGHGKIDVLALDRQRRRDAPHRAALRPALDVHAQAELEAALRRQRAELVVRLARVPILHELDAAQESHAAHVA